MTSTEIPRNIEKTTDKDVPDLFEFAHYLLHRMKILLAIVLLGIALACVYCYAIAKPVYESTALLYVVNSKNSAINLSDLQIGSYLASDFQWVFTTWEVNQQVIDNLHLPYTVAQMKKMLTVTNPSNTRMLLITFASTNAKESATVANEYATVTSQYISDYLLTDQPSIVSVALEPQTPVRPRPMIIIATSGIGAGALAIWCLFIAFLCNDKVKTAADIKEHMGVMPLAVIPITTSTSQGRKRKGYDRNG